MTEGFGCNDGKGCGSDGGADGDGGEGNWGCGVVQSVGSYLVCQNNCNALVPFLAVQNSAICDHECLPVESGLGNLTTLSLALSFCYH